MTSPVPPAASPNTAITTVAPIHVDRCPITDEAQQKLLTLPDLHALEDYSGTKVALGITCYSLFTPDSGQPWTLDVYDCSSPHTPLSSDQAKILTIIEGKARVRLADREIELLPAHSLCLPPGTSYTLTPLEKGCRYLLLSMAAQPKPEDTVVRPLDRACYKSIFEQGKNCAYELIDGASVDGRFNMVILDIQESSRHYHLKMASTLVALGGDVALELDGKHQTAKPGELLQIPTIIVHQIRSTTSTPARVLCLNFPALDVANDIFNV